MPVARDNRAGENADAIANRQATKMNTRDIILLKQNDNKTEDDPTFYELNCDFCVRKYRECSHTEQTKDYSTNISQNCVLFDKLIILHVIEGVF
jgi:hypothetical protein